MEANRRRQLEELPERGRIAGGVARNAREIAQFEVLSGTALRPCWHNAEASLLRAIELLPDDDEVGDDPAA